MSISRFRLTSVALSLLFALAFQTAASAQTPITKKINVPEEDRFVPFAVTIHVGDSIEWINNDEDDHTVVSVDKFTTAGHRGTNHLLPGLESNNDQPGTFTLTFHRKGRFVYYCRFHAKLDSDNQPMAPGPDGGIEVKKNFGTPMSGIVVVLPANQ